MAILELKTQDYQKEVLLSDKPVVIDFWATWCGPCRMMAPIVDKLAEEHPEWKFCKVNVDEEGALAARFGIESIPTIAYLENGTLVSSAVGYMTKEMLLARLLKK